jgi:hypothetical protein
MLISLFYSDAFLWKLWCIQLIVTFRYWCSVLLLQIKHPFQCIEVTEYEGSFNAILVGCEVSDFIFKKY